MPHELLDGLEGGGLEGDSTDITLILIDEHAEYLMFYFGPFSNMAVEVRCTPVHLTAGFSRAAMFFILVE